MDLWGSLQGRETTPGHTSDHRHHRRTQTPWRASRLTASENTTEDAQQAQTRGRLTTHKNRQGKAPQAYDHLLARNRPNTQHRKYPCQSVSNLTWTFLI